MGEKKIEQAIRSTGTTINAAATDTEGVHPDLRASASLQQASVKNRATARTPDCRANSR